MIGLFRRRVALHELSVYILTRGLALTVLFLFVALSLFFVPGSWLGDRYAEQIIAMGAVLLGASLLGPLLLEDVIRKKG